MKISNLELEKTLDKNLKKLFKPLVDADVRYLKDEKYYHFLDEKLYVFLDKYFKKVDSMYLENLESLSGNLGQYIYMSYFGEPINLDRLIALEEEEKFDESSFGFEDLSTLVDTAKFRSKEISESEPINENEIYDLVIQSFLEVYNKKK